MTKKTSIYIPHFKLRLLEFEEDIATHRDKLRNICHKEQYTFLQNKLKLFKNKLYNDLKKKKVQKTK